MKLIFQLAVVLALFFGIWFVLGKVNWMSTLRLEQISKKTEKKLGDIFWDLYKRSEKEVEDSTIIKPVDTLLTKICVANGIAREDVKLHIVDKKEVNAFAMPNRHLVVYSGLIKNCQNEMELSGVLSHEVAHMQKNHVMRKLGKEIGLSVLASIVGGGGGETAREAIKLLSSSAYDRKLEKEADLGAVEYMTKAGMDPTALADFLTRMAEDEKDIPQAMYWISTHPDSKERARYIREKAHGSQQTYLMVLSPGVWQAMQEEVKDL